eukprot:TRINITY_DN461_c2_g1_i1.p1 TRINITY_DN461_c2_g1~~TRINITY_DN461_c2_g1_i1.p1  ORF type:complete len:284 (-),score=91.13 TRINITY_DN461_c2_g1_i1:75-926(-)
MEKIIKNTIWTISATICKAFFFYVFYHLLVFIFEWQKQFNFSEQTIIVYLSLIIHQFTFWSWSLLLLLLDFLKKPSYLFEFKIQKKVFVSASEYLNCFKIVLFNQLFIGLPITLLTHIVLKRFDFNVSISNQIPSISIIAIHFFGCVTIEEILFYYSHRFLHSKLMYIPVHKMHHTFNAPVGAAAEYAHPIEFIFSNLLPVILGPFLLHSHVIVLWIWLIIAISSTVNSHSGYDFPGNPFASTRFHDFHHSSPNSNYGSIGILDYIHKTDQWSIQKQREQKQK